MNLGEKILKLRKKQGISQEQLGEKVNVTRQTISNWELGETFPNPEQLKLLSKIFQVSIDELLDNEIENIIVEKVSNTEKLAGMIIKILKVLGVLFLVFLVIDILALIFFTSIGKLPNVESSVTTVCSMDDKNYVIEFGTNEYFKCDKCSKEMNQELRKIVNFNQLEKSIDNVEQYFINHHGNCE